MSLETMTKVWRHSPDEGRMLILHMAVAEAAIDDMMNMQATMLLSELQGKTRFQHQATLMEHLEEMQQDGHLEELDFKDVGQSWATVTFSMNFENLLPSALERQNEHLSQRCHDMKNELELLRLSTGISGYVYLLKAGPHVKIGKTTNLDRRLDQLAIQLPYQPEIIHSLASQTPLLLEHHFHALFTHKRMNGEWFDLPEGEIKFFCSLSRIDIQPPEVPTNVLTG